MGRARATRPCGFDTVLFYGPRAYYTVSVSTDSDVVVVSALTGTEGQDWLIDVERLAFTDQIVFVQQPQSNRAGWARALASRRW